MQNNKPLNPGCSKSNGVKPPPTNQRPPPSPQPFSFVPCGDEMIYTPGATATWIVDNALATLNDLYLLDSKAAHSLLNYQVNVDKPTKNPFLLVEQEPGCYDDMRALSVLNLINGILQRSTAINVRIVPKFSNNTINRKLEGFELEAT